MHKTSVYVLPVIAFVFLSFTIAARTRPDQDKKLNESIERGEKVYQAKCLTCHMANGQGIPSVYPPLVATENIADKVFLSRVVKNGLRGTFVIKGLTYKATMEGTNLTDKEIADVLNYVRNSWGNAYDLVTPEEVNTFLKQENETGK